MRSLRPRLVVRLRITLVDIEPAIWRDVLIDRSARLSVLHDVIQQLFDGDSNHHHVFRTATAPADGVLVNAPPWMADIRGRTRSPWGTVRTPESRRWGDKWTMIDLRDPTVEDESSVAVGLAVRGSSALFYSWQSERLWTCRIDVYEDDVLAPSAPEVQLVEGANRAPLPGCPDAATYDAWLRVLEDAAHEDHRALRALLDSDVGPWSRFDPTEFDVGDAQSRLGTLEKPPRRAVGWYDRGLSMLETLVRSLPASNRAGLRQHLDRSGAGMPPIVTEDDAADLVRPFRELIEVVGRDGVELVEGSLPPARVLGAAVEDANAITELASLVAAARQFGLLYLRRGRVIASRTAVDASSAPLRLWRLMAAQLLRRRMTGADDTANQLFLLAIADGTLTGSDPDAAIRRIAVATDLVTGTRYGPPYVDEENAATLSLHVGDERQYRYPYEYPYSSEYGYESPYARWHAGREAALKRALETSERTDQATGRMLTCLDSLVRTLEPLGLARSDEGRWVVPDGLREFARAALA